METGNERIRALCLLSGGLDGQLAICVLKEQGIEVQAVTFESPFFSGAKAKAAADQLGVTHHLIGFTGDIVQILKGPKHGFGANLNPCIDCHIQMLRRAGALMTELGFHFLATGEVLNQRPMSQNPQALALVARESGCEEVLVRPLSATRLPETEPERRGWVDRGKLLGLEGRMRKPQLELAEKYRLKDFPSPAGGCLLTEPNFCIRLKDLMTHEGLNGTRNIELLRIGRHLRLSPTIKLIVGRNERDNAALEGAAELYDLLLKTEGVPGPTGLLPLTACEAEIELAAAICARYSDSSPEKAVTVRVRSTRGTKRLEVRPCQAEQADSYRI
ncbi:MAG: tRNA 4-thiouridine(8) synthase ThiI [Kiritimatiellae bacterium]|nr:tRNA 4-thiouridine(8) synthase ThiI [Kiritimatiellia bacterium]